MSHEVETMAYNKVETPWHGLGKAVEADLTPEQMLKEAQLDWTVRLEPCYTVVNDQVYTIAREALVRSSDNKVLDIVSSNWSPVQNITAASFYNEFVANGDMNMETAGSLCGGQIVWFLAKMKESFDLFKGRDKVDSYLLFTNPHRYGWSTSVSMTPIRVVCKNTLMLSLSSNAKDKIIKVSHSQEFNPEEVKLLLVTAAEKLAKYKEMAQFLSQKKAPKEDIVEYFKRVFPMLSSKEDNKELSKSAKKCLDILPQQPGAELGEGTWWQPFNAVTFFADHVASKEADTRLTNSWFGNMRRKKVEALETALEYAEASPSI
jgi:phage/plasmid-like protein (TIGR03299 family)